MTALRTTAVLLLLALAGCGGAAATSAKPGPIVFAGRPVRLGEGLAPRPKTHVVPTVTIALIGDPAHQGARISEDEWERSWDERPRIELKVGDNESLGSIVDRAQNEFDVVLGEGVVSAHVVDLALRQEDADEVKVWDLTLVDDEGRVIWTAHDLRFIPYSQLVHSVEAGVVVGDPRSLYVVLKEPIGNGLGIDWAEIIQAWEVVDEVVRRIGDYGGAAAALAAAYH